MSEKRDRNGGKSQLDVLTNSHPAGRSPTFCSNVKRKCVREGVRWKMVRKLGRPLFIPVCLNRLKQKTLIYLRVYGSPTQTIRFK